jgi:hypothetical protein
MDEYAAGRTWSELEGMARIGLLSFWVDEIDTRLPAGSSNVSSLRNEFSGMSGSDRDLGMDRPVTRRDFVEGAGTIAVGSLIAGNSRQKKPKNQAKPPGPGWEPDARILILDSHDDFGGHSRRNEFSIDGRTILSHGGGQTLENPAGYSESSKCLLRDVGGAIGLNGFCIRKPDAARLGRWSASGKLPPGQVPAPRRAYGWREVAHF